MEGLSDSLELFQVKTLITSYPKLFEKLFVGCNNVVTKDEFKDLIATLPGMHHVKLQLLHGIGVFIDESSEEGKFY